MISQGISLSRLAITGPVNLLTPNIVLTEIADAHGIRYDNDNMLNQKYLIQLINTINTTGVSTIRKPYDRKDYRLMARFVNRKEQQWKIGTLTQAFDFLMEYTKLNKIYQPCIGFTFGPQTPKNYTSLNASVLYGICVANRINTRNDSSIDEMASNIEMLYNLGNATVNNSVKRAIYESTIYGGCEGYQLVNILSQIDPDRSINIMNLATSRDTNNSPSTIIQNIENTQEIIIDYNSLYRSANIIRARMERSNNIRSLPRTHVDAVVMAAIYYKMDISKSINPLAEYQELNRTPYFPIDREIVNRLRETNKHPDTILNPYLNKIFNPELPSNLYENEDLTEMCISEGYDIEQIEEEGSYQILQFSYFMPTFFHGKQGNITHIETTLLDEIDELEYDNVVVYGIRNNEMRFYTYGELTDTFSSLRRFQKPDGDNTLFSEDSINKLYNLSTANQRHDEMEEVFLERISLSEKIEEIRVYQQTNQEQVLEFYTKYYGLNNDQKRQVDNTFILLLECAMYMRGWVGTGPYPLSSEDARTDIREQPSVDLRVTESIAELEATVDQLKDIDAIGSLFKELPLMFYNYRNGDLLASTDEGEGLTIFDRINIVKGGENVSINSCIRMSSNRFVASAYYYMSVLNIPLNFDISDMSNIA